MRNKLSKRFCHCCGYPSAQQYHDYWACYMCLPSMIEKIVEITVNDDGKARRAIVNQLIHKCESKICGKNKIFTIQIFVKKYLD